MMMKTPVYVIGIGANGIESLSKPARDALAGATFLAGGKRHLELVGATNAKTFAITNNLLELDGLLINRAADERCVVLGSGDPLFFGIGARVVKILGSDQVIIIPNVSSVQLAFARSGIAWDDCTIASVHSRPIVDELTPLLGRPKIALLTRDGGSPAAIASFLLDRGRRDYQMTVCEDLGGHHEHVGTYDLSDVQQKIYNNLNIVILMRTNAAGEEIDPARRDPDRAKEIKMRTVENRSPSNRNDSPSFPRLLDCDFAQPETGPILLTHSDVRAVAIARFRGIGAGPIWDVGAGLGGMSVELARAFPDREIVAVERTEDRLMYLRVNQERFAVTNLIIIAGNAPEALEHEDRPAAVFVGGSGGKLEAIVAFSLKRLAPEGVFVAHFIGLEHVNHCLILLRAAGMNPTATLVQISPAKSLAGLTTFIPLRPVWIVEGKIAAERIDPTANDPTRASHYNIDKIL